MDKEGRDTMIAEQYLLGLPASRLAREFSISIPLVRKILAAKGVKASQRKAPTTQEDHDLMEHITRKAVTRSHERVGEKLAYQRNVTFRHTRAVTAGSLGWTVHKVAAVERGTYDLTLVDLLDLQTYTKISIGDLIDTSENR